MTINIYISAHCGNPKISNEQQRICSVLDTKNIPFQTIDISAPGMELQRDFMRSHGNKREGQRNVLPPQIFNGEQFRGDFVDFDIANEDDNLEEFLGIPRKSPKIEFFKTGATATDVGQILPGNLLNKEEINESSVLPSEVSEVISATDLENTIEEDFEETDHIECDERQQQQTARLKVIKSLETDAISASVQEAKLCPEEKEVVEADTNDHSSTGLESDAAKQIESFQEEVVQEAIENEKQKVVEKTDGLMNLTKHVLVSADYDVTPKTTDIENIRLTPLSDSSGEKTSLEQWEDSEDSETDSETSDSEDEFMADGERVRKTSRGFKQISNCKRFWKASLLTG